MENILLNCALMFGAVKIVMDKQRYKFRERFYIKKMIKYCFQLK